MSADGAGGPAPDHRGQTLAFRERRLKMRTLDEQLTVHAPRLYRAVARRILRLPLSSRLRGRMIGRRTMAGYHAMNRGDVDLLLAIYDPQVVVRFHPGGPMPPDLTGEHHGHDGFRELWQAWSDSWEEFRFEPEEVIDLGEAILVSVTLQGRGRASGIETRMPLYEVFRFRDGIIFQHEDFTDKGAAERAVGLG
jgi:ketosteroid isomerase-like protein